MRLAIVTPWFGSELRGGAEKQSWQLAHHLTARGHAVDVLTTCAASFDDDWSRNRLRPGSEKIDGFTVRRFKVGKRDRRAFARVNAILTALEPKDLKRSVSPIGDEDAAIFAEQNINSPALMHYLETRGREYHSIVFIPYLYGTTLAGISRVAQRAFLQPCLHDESYAYLPAVSEAFHRAKGLLFNSEGEFEIALRLFGPGIIPKSTVVGQGVDDFPALAQAPGRVGTFVPRDEHYVLYLGRQDPAKNIGLLVHAFGEFKRRHPMSRLKLVLAGQRPTSYGDSTKDIVDVGPVGECEKMELLRHMRALVQPSLMESYSRVMIEAWLSEKPVIVHEDCLATATVVRNVDGGLLAGSTSAWEGALYGVDVAEDETLAAMGRRGAAYAHQAANWNLVIDNYERALGITGAGATNGRHVSGAHANGSHKNGAQTNGAHANGAAHANGSAPWPAVDPRVWDRDDDRPLAKALQDGCTNLIYVGALTSIEPLNQLLTSFLHYLTLDRESRLVIVGRGEVDDQVYERLYAEVRSLDLVDHVLLARDVLTPQLQAVYRTASVFWSLDEVAPPLEGFVEAMWFDVPILTYKSPAAIDAVGDAALVIREKDDLLSVAVLAQMVATDRSLREKIVTAQRVARARFSTALTSARSTGARGFSFPSESIA